MLKKILLFCLVFGTIGPADAYKCFDCKSGKSVEVQNVNDCNFVWSYSALAQSMTEMRNNCEVTNAEKFTTIGNWARGNNACFSVNEFMNYCLTQKGASSLNAVKIGEKNTFCRVLNGKNIKEETGAVIDDKRVGCETLLAKWVLEQEIVRKTGLMLQNAAPGTYVENVRLKSGRKAYRVVDVVLAKNYLVDGEINQAVNSKAENTKIYLLNRNSKPTDTGLRTWTNDMFMDVQSTKNKVGGVRGAAKGAYIYYQEDLTTELYSYYDSNRGRALSSVHNAYSSRSGGNLDIKQDIGRRYNVLGQTEGQSHQNGFLFKGKIGTADWLGNVLYGMNRQEAVLPNAAADTLAWAESKLTNKGKVDPEPVRNAWDFGSQLVKDAGKSVDNHFENTQTKIESEAFELAKKRMLNFYSAVVPVKCVGNCNEIPGVQDVVICTDKNGKRVEFRFDDICDGRSIRSAPDVYSNPVYHK